MRGGSSLGVEDLAARGPIAHHAILGSSSELTTPSRVHSAAAVGLRYRRMHLSWVRSLPPILQQLRAVIGRSASPTPQAKLRDLTRISAVPGATLMDWVVFSSWVSAIAQADVTRRAREIPIARRMGIASSRTPLPDHAVRALSRYLARTNAQEPGLVRVALFLRPQSGRSNQTPDLLPLTAFTALLDTRAVPASPPASIAFQTHGRSGCCRSSDRCSR